MNKKKKKKKKKVHVHVVRSLASTQAISGHVPDVLTINFFILLSYPPWAKNYGTNQLGMDEWKTKKKKQKVQMHVWRSLSEGIHPTYLPTSDHQDMHLII